ncbi:MAG: hypothetical protein H7Z13_01810 [Ferruginibacter sp.]|nr:hypothetical protein [Ferruginibacter sp.]
MQVELMKQLAAILLLGIFSFNLFGYRVVAIFLENHENEKMELAFDENDYSDSRLISIKQPTNLPYYTNSVVFHRIDGEVNIDGIIYKYVKCRIYNDSLEMLCIPNTAKMKIQSAKADFSKMASDFQQSNNKKKSSSDSKPFQKTISEFEEQQSSTIAFNLKQPALNYYIQNHLFVNKLFTKSIEQPPDISSIHS